jgi:hypothetical protein
MTNDEEFAAVLKHAAFYRERWMRCVRENELLRREVNELKARNAAEASRAQSSLSAVDEHKSRQFGDGRL